MKREIKVGSKLDTKMDLAPLNYNKLRSLRKKAEEMGLREFVSRIDTHTARLKQANGSVSDRENAFIQVFGRVPTPEEMKRRSAFHAALNILYIEVPEGALEPIKPGDQIVPGAKWQWAKSSAKAKRERAAMRVEHDADALEIERDFRDLLKGAYARSSVVVAALYKPRAGKTGTKFRLTALKGQVVDFTDEGGFVIQFEGGVQ